MTLRLGFIGCGLIARAHVSRLADVSDASIHLLHDTDGSRAASLAETAGGSVAESADQVIEGCDAIYVTTWTSEHADIVERVAAAGKSVFCEKPLGTDLASAQKMSADVEAAGVVNQVGLVLRHSPAFRWIQHHMASGEYGQRMSLVFRDDQYIPNQGLYGSSWRGDVTKAGAGTLLEHSIHDLDLIEWISGPITQVSCITANVHGIEGIEDQATVMLKAADGGTAILSSTWHDVMTRPSQRHVEGFCVNGYFSLTGDWGGPVGMATGDEPTETWEGWDVANRATALDGLGHNPDADFVQSVLLDRPAYPDFGVALRAHVLADAAYRSAAAGGVPVDV